MSDKRLADVAFVSGAAVIAGLAGATDAHAQGMAGAYGGFTFGKAIAGKMDVYGIGYSIHGVGVGGFVGYNMVQGNWVFGGELALSGNYGSDFQYSKGGESFSINRLVDLKARAGHTFGKTFVYGVVGYSKAQVDTGPYWSPADVSVDGVSVGLGFEAPLSQNSFIGGEVLSRKLDTSGTIYGSMPATTYLDVNHLTTATMRIGFRF